ncbi:MAG: HAMP domain-containing sensor histidine kinase [Planctomycetota bacterium]
MNQSRNNSTPALSGLWIRLTVVWTIAWILGLLVFAVVTSMLATRYYQEQVQSRLRIQAIAVYGLAYFDDDGSFESDLLEYDDDLFEPGAAVWFIEPADPPVVHLADDRRFTDSKLNDLAAMVVRTGMDHFESGTDQHGNPYQLLAIPTYEVDQLDPRAAIIVATNPQATIDAKTRLLTWTGVLFTLLGLAGVVVGALIARWSQRPLAAFIAQREHFLSAAAHELRTPLASISAVVESGKAGNEPPGDSLARLTPLIDKATGSMEDLLLYARLDAGNELMQRQPIRLDLLVEVCLPDEVDCKLVCQETTVTGDERLLKAVIRNLLSNSLRHASTPAAIEIQVCENRLSFENDGASFSDHLIARATNEDFTIAPSSTGSGLGLAIVQKVMKLHGGRMRVGNTASGNALVVCQFDG